MDYTRSNSMDALTGVSSANDKQVGESGQILNQQDAHGQLQDSKLAGPILQHDPSYSGEWDPYTYLILSQL